MDDDDSVGVEIDVVRRRRVRGSDAFVAAVKSVVVLPPRTSVSYDDNDDDGDGDDDIVLLALDSLWRSPICTGNVPVVGGEGGKCVDNDIGVVLRMMLSIIVFFDLSCGNDENSTFCADTSASVPPGS